MTVNSFVVNCSIGGFSGVVLARILLLWNFPEIVYWVRFRMKSVCFDRFWCSCGANGVSCSFPVKEVCFWPICSNSVDTASLTVSSVDFLSCGARCRVFLFWNDRFHIFYTLYMCAFVCFCNVLTVPHLPARIPSFIRYSQFTTLC